MSAEKAAEQQDELAALYPAPRSVVIAERLIAVKRLGLSRLMLLGNLLSRAYADTPAFLDSLEDDALASVPLIVAATDAPAEWAMALDPLDRLLVIAEILEVNAAGFQRALPSLDRFLMALNRIGGDGPMSSESSSDPDTSGQPTTRPTSPLDSSSPSSAKSAANAANA